MVEPLLADPDWRSEFEAVVRAAGGEATTVLVPEPSPEAVVRLGEAGRRWSFVFIDGDHDGEAPTATRSPACLTSNRRRWRFSMTSSRHTSPRACRAFEAAGWNVVAYQTAQMVGVAWRGDVAPVAHIPDPTQTWSVPDHLIGIPIAGTFAD